MAITVCRLCVFLMHMLYTWHIYAHTCPRYAHQILGIMAYRPNLVGIFVSGTYLAITCEIEAAVGFALAYICKTLGLYAHNMLVMLAVFGMWQPHLLSDMHQICVQCSLLNG